MSTDPKISNISIIIPTRDEAGILGKLLPSLTGIPGVEVIVVDCSSTDNTVGVAQSFDVHILRNSAGKAAQMNAGAQAAKGDILLFLHADTALSPGFAEQVRRTVADKEVAAGAFRLAINGPGLGLRIIEWLANVRSRLMQMPYGDQAIFLSAQTFTTVGGFPDLPIMEDFELVRRLKRKGRIKVLGLAATTSPRRWQKLGILRTTVINQLIILGFLVGVSPQKLAEWYRKGCRLDAGGN